MTWVVIGVVGAVTVLFKASGPVVLGRRELPPRALALVEVLAPAMLAAGIAIRLRAPLLLVMVVAAATAALIRLF